MSVSNGSSNNRSRANTHSLFVIFFVLTVAFSLIFAGVLRSNNNSIRIVPPAHATKSGGSSSGGSSSSSTAKKNEDEEERQENPQEKQQERDHPELEQQERVHQQEETQETPQEKLQEQQNPLLEQQEQQQLQQQEQQSVPGVVPGTNPPPTGTTLPPSTTCEPGSNTPECQKASAGPTIDCAKNPQDPSCKTTEPTLTADCTANPSDPSCITHCQENGSCVQNQFCKLNPQACQIKEPEPVNGSNGNGGGGGGGGGGIGNGTGGGIGSGPSNETGGGGGIGNETGRGSGNETNPNPGNETNASLKVKVGVDHDPILLDNTQTISVAVSDSKSSKSVSGADVSGKVIDASGSTNERFSGTTDSNGELKTSWTIDRNSNTGTYHVKVDVSASGYESASKTTTFEVEEESSEGGNSNGGGTSESSSSTGFGQQAKYFKEFTDMPPNSPLYITNTFMHKDTLNNIVITGEIKNRGTSTADFVELIATFYDINNKTVGNQYTFTEPTTLQPGQAAPFTMYLSPNDMPLDEINSVKYHLSWQHAAGSSPSSPSAASKILPQIQ